VGDRVLRSVAARLLSSVRPGDTVARYGGDEFTIVCSELGDERDAIALAGRIRAAVSKPLPLADGALSMSTSVGIVVVRSPWQRPASVIAAADDAMYRAKHKRTPYELVQL
jgi:diguanylate cyclase (GGDEF)-like protein